MRSIIPNTMHTMSQIAVDQPWSFGNIGRKDTSYITYGYHRYPAKFIPQITAGIIEKYTSAIDFQPPL